MAALPPYIVKLLEERGVDPVAYVTELVLREVDPSDRERLYEESSEYFWTEGLSLVEKGELRQGGEKIWNSVVQLVKAIAESRGWRHDSHRLVWVILRKIAEESGDREVIALFAQVEQLHVNFYEGHLSRVEMDVFIDAARKLREKLKALRLGHASGTKPS